MTTVALDRAPARSAWRAVALVATLVGIAASLGMEISGFHASPLAVRPEVAYATVHALVPLTWAVCVIVGLHARERALPLGLEIAFVWLWIPQTFFAVVARYGAVWPLLRAVDLVWALVVGLLALSYPRGAWVGRVERTVVIVGVVSTGIRGVVALLAVTDTTECGCAPNAYGIVPESWFFAVDLVYRLLGAALVLFVAGVVAARWLRGTAVQRGVSFVMPIGVAAWAAVLLIDGIGSAARGPVTTIRLVSMPATDGPVGLISLLAIASVPICYVAGTLRLRSTRRRVADLVEITREGADRTLWRESLARTLDDPSVRVYWWDGVVYRDEDGDEALLEDPPSGALLPIADAAGDPIALIRHAGALTADERLLDGVSAALRLTVDNDALRSQIERTLAQVRESRARIVEAGDADRKRLERDLHDGSQQQLVAVAMSLRTIITAAEADERPTLAADLESALGGLTVALRELRELARGIHPTTLVDGGLALGLRELAARCPIPVTCTLGELPRMSALVESTAYFVVSESLVNVARHARAAHATLDAEVRAGELRIDLADDGVGGIDPAHSRGTGLTGLTDRVEAVGGRIAVRSPSGGGTSISVRLPLVMSERSG